MRRLIQIIKTYRQFQKLMKELQCVSPYAENLPRKNIALTERQLELLISMEILGIKDRENLIRIWNNHMLYLGSPRCFTKYQILEAIDKCTDKEYEAWILVKTFKELLNIA